MESPEDFEKRLAGIKERMKGQTIKARKPQPGEDGFRDNTMPDHERAHPGKAGWKPRHGQDAIGKVK